MSADDAFASIVDAFRADARVTQAQMFGSPGLKIGGKVFAMLHKRALVVKLPNARASVLVASGDAAFFDPGHGRLMKEWVAVGPGDRARWLALAREAEAFVASGSARGGRPPAATRRKGKGS